jgi:CDP-glucose 4,6-dehydratase
MLLNTLPTFYQGKRIFLTGHTGFKGAWLLDTLHLLKAQVKGYAQAPITNPNLYDILQGDTKCESVIADLMERERLRKEILDFQPDVIFHLAAQPLVRLSYDIPQETFGTNVLGTANVLDAVRFLEKPCAVVIITTDKVYENKEWIFAYRENDALGGYDPYSASKACAEIVTQAYTSSFFNPEAYAKHQKGIATARAGNVIGGGDWSKDRIIPDIIRALTEDKPIVLRNPNALRPWQHVIEALMGYLLLGMRLYENPTKFWGAWNFGPSLYDNLSVETVAQIAINTWGSGSYEIMQLENAPHEANLLKLDTNKTTSLLDWRGEMDFIQAIEETIAWYKHYQTEPETIATYSKKFIQRYFGL